MRGIDDDFRYATLVDAETVRLAPNGYLACIAFRGPDAISGESSTIIDYEDRLTAILGTLNSSWGYHFSMTRTGNAEYPTSGAWPHPIVYALDVVRQLRYTTEGAYRPGTHRLWLSYYPEKYANSVVTMLLGSTERESTDIEHFQATVRTIVAAMNNICKDTQRLGLREIVEGTTTVGYTSDLVNTLAEEIDLHQHCYLIDPHEPTMLAPLLVPYRILFDPLTIGDMPTIVASIYGYPDAARSALFSAFTHLPYRMKMTTRIIPLSPNEGTVATFKRSRAFLLSSLNLSMIVPRRARTEGEGNATALNHRDSLQFAGDRIDSGVPYALTNTIITIGLENESQRADVYSTLDSLAQHLRVKVTPERSHGGYVAWLAGLPGELDRHRARRALFSMRASIRTSPVTSTWHGHKTHPNKRYPSPSPILTLTTPSREAHRLYHHSGETGHTMIYGKTGYGKSVLLRALENGHLARYKGGMIITLDIGFSALAYAHAIGGQHRVAHHDHGPQFAFLTGLHDPKKRTAILDTCVELAETWEHRPLTASERRDIETGLNSLAENPDPNNARLSNLGTLIPDANLRSLFGKFQDSFLDAGTDNIDFSHPTMNYWCIEYGTLGSKNYRWINPLVSYIQRRAYESFEERPIAPRLIVMDEIANAFHSPRISELAERINREGRKHLTSLIGATQTPLEIINSPAGPAILALTATRISFQCPMSNPEMKQAYLAAGFTEDECAAIEKLPPFHFLVSTRDGTQICSLEPDLLEQAIYGGASDDNTRIIYEKLQQHGEHWLTPYLETRVDIPGLQTYVEGLSSLLGSIESQQQGALS